MDESHRYRASAGVRAINELKPILGLELTATPFTEGARGAVPFKNVIFDYPLSKAMADSFANCTVLLTPTCPHIRFSATGTLRKTSSDDPSQAEAHGGDRPGNVALPRGQTRAGGSLGVGEVF